jgi:hypothetical protein
MAETKRSAARASGRFRWKEPEAICVLHYFEFFTFFAWSDGFLLRQAKEALHCQSDMCVQRCRSSIQEDSKENREPDEQQ